jgi:hypothetical protein
VIPSRKTNVIESLLLSSYSRSLGPESVQAYAKHFTRTEYIDGGDQEEQPILVVPMGEFKEPLTTMSRFGFGVNVMIFRELQWRTWTLPAYTMYVDRLDKDALWDAQEPLFSAVISKVFTKPDEAWYPYAKSIH